MTPTLSHDAARNIPRFLIQQCPVWSGKMTAGGDGFAAVVGGLALHIPVLGRPAIDFLNVRDGGVYIDATFGAGGYTRAILAAANARAIALGADLVQAANGR